MENAKQIAYRLRKKNNGEFLVVTGTWVSTPQGIICSEWRLNDRQDGEIWEVPTLALATIAQHRWVPENWQDATHDRPINAYFLAETEIVRVTTTVEVVG